MTELNDKQIRILQVAERLFAEKGFDGTSIRDISREAGSNIAMVSYYFGSKEKMLEALILHRIRDMRLQLENLMRENLSPPQKMERLVDLYLERVNKKPLHLPNRAV
ncbi:TetR/AcrR family transcriptional regulator [Flavobacterium sp. N1718]|uniref:TetR/AcrR family transcriptional regulator n=1 Tax=Flavobacterium sp. N1718 TaxID=2986822 RepID=UPI0029CAC288|nr:TetR family transcriptional regulator [Flavobacterium sp. N1718]